MQSGLIHWHHRGWPVLGAVSGGLAETPGIPYAGDRPALNTVKPS
jgi:hypothetical protein